MLALVLLLPKLLKEPGAADLHDAARPKSFLLRAARCGHPDAVYRLAQSCRNGWGLPLDRVASAQLLKRAAELKHPAAMCEHGQLLKEEPSEERKSEGQRLIELS